MNENNALASAQGGDTVEVFTGCSSILFRGSSIRADIRVFVVNEVQEMCGGGGGCNGVVIAFLGVNAGKNEMTFAVVKTNQ